MRPYLLLLSFILLLSACSKEPGPGGRGEITGRVLAQNYNNSTYLPIGEPYPFAEQRVYIIYGDNEYHDDDVRTGLDGRFRFSGLKKGDYTIYVISQKPRTSEDQSGSVVVSRQVQLENGRASVDVGNMLVDRYRGWQDN